jgi:hypothetical protein
VFVVLERCGIVDALHTIDAQSVRSETEDSNKHLAVFATCRVDTMVYLSDVVVARCGGDKDDLASE